MMRSGATPVAFARVTECSPKVPGSVVHDLQIECADNQALNSA